MMFMGCAAMAINYIDRANLAVAAPFIREELGVNATVMGEILGAFFWTYAIMQLPFGWFADRVGARIALAVAVTWWSIATVLTATANGIAALTGYRLLLGVGEANGPSRPASSTAVRGSARPCRCRWSHGSSAASAGGCPSR